MIISFLLSNCGITSKVRNSLTPQRQDVNSFPESYKINYEAISFQTQDSLNLKGWWIKGTSDITVVLSHSFGSNRSGWKGCDAKGNFHEINWLPSIKVLADAGFNVVAFDHRACGESDGEMTYFGKMEALDIVAVINWVTQRDSMLTKFGIVGFSSGANATLKAIQILENEDTKLELSGIAVNLYWYERMIKNSTKFFTNVPSFMIPAINKSTRKIVGFNPKIEINPANDLSIINSPIRIVNAEFDEIASMKDIFDIYKKGLKHSELSILKNENRFEAYHFIENHQDDVISYFVNTLNAKKNKVEFNQAAVLLIEFQKTWTEKGIFNNIIKNEYVQRNVLSNTKKVIQKAREKGIKVIQAPLILDKTDVNYKKTPLPARLLKQFTVDTWKSEFTDEIYDNSDIVIKGRYGFDATEGSDLEQQLKLNNIKTVYICGFTTDHCVRETMNSLIAKGFVCIMISDCSATKNSKLQKKIEDEFSIISSNELIDKITD